MISTLVNFVKFTICLSRDDMMSQSTTAERAITSPDSGVEGEGNTVRLINLIQKSDWPTIEHVLREMDKKGEVEVNATMT